MELSHRVFQEIGQTYGCGSTHQNKKLLFKKKSKFQFRLFNQTDNVYHSNKNPTFCL